MLWLGDLNGCTKSCGGWSGQEPLFSSFVEGTRSSKCQKDLDREGREILSICEASECCILNGLKLDDAPLTSSSSVTRPACMAKDRVQDVVNFESEDEEELLGTVLDYYISSADLLPQFESLEVLPKERFSDHCPVLLRWNGYVRKSGTSSVVGSSSVLGWSISKIPDVPSEYEQLKQRSAYIMSRHSDLPTVKTLIAEGESEMAYRTIHLIIREALEEAGASLRASDGSRRDCGTPRVAALPVKTWFDSEARTVHRAWQKLRFEKAGAKKRGTLDIALEIACAAARQRYRRLRLEKMMQFSKEWERFWEDVRCDHVSVWNILRRISGKIATMSCMASPEEQRRHISELSLIQENADFDEPSSGSN